MAMAEIKLPIQVNLPDDWIEQIVERLKNDPDAEWVEVIRCKDCKFWKNQDASTRWLPCMNMQMNGHWYCGSAERREDAKVSD